MSAVLETALDADRRADCERNDRVLADWQRQVAADIADAIPLDDEQPARRYRSRTCPECRVAGSHAFGCPEGR